MNCAANELNQHTARAVPDLFSVFESPTVETATGGTWTRQTATVFCYDRFNLVGEDIGGPGSTPAETNYFVWGPDLSGAPVFNEFSANVNVGQTVSSDGTLAAASHFRFSTKYGDSDLGLYYYGFRYYSPGMGRWLSRDPIWEEGGLNIYCMLENSSVNDVDVIGEKRFKPRPDPGPSKPKKTVPNPKTRVPPPGKPALPSPSFGANAKRFGGYGYWRTSCCSSKEDRLSPIPGVSTPSENPIRTVGPIGGDYEIYPFPTTPPSAVGGDGAGPCNILVVKCSGFVGVFHFAVGDSPRSTLRSFSWPSGCSAIICGGNDSDQSNCLGDDVKSAANTAGINIVGVAESTGCGVDASENWYQY